MEYRQFGQSNLRVSRLGFGLAEIGRQLTMSDATLASRLLNSALDAGMTFFDTAANYAISEQLVGLGISHRRSEYVLATKCGNALVDPQDQPWTSETVRKSIERSLRMLRTDHLDLTLLHSCTLEVLERGDVIRALQDAQRKGLTSLIGYSGDNDAAEWAVASGLFQALETSFNLVDQKARRKLFPDARSRGMGVIAKRPLANGAWGVERCPSEYATEYFRRAREMGPIQGDPGDPIMFSLGFVFAHAEVDVAIAGTRNPEHLARNLQLEELCRGIGPEAVEELRRRFDRIGDSWPQMN